MYYYDDLVCDAKGEVSAAVSGSGELGSITLSTLVRDRYGQEQVFTNNTVDWSSRSEWGESGSLKASSALHLIDTISWDAQSYFNYADHEYALFVHDVDYANRSDVFHVHAFGGYGGNWNDW